MSKKKFLILTIVSLLASLTAVLFVIFAPEKEVPQTPDEAPPTKDLTLSEADIESITLLANTYIEKIGTYGLFEEDLVNQANVNMVYNEGASSLLNIRSFTPLQVQAAYEELTGKSGVPVNEISSIVPVGVKTVPIADGDKAPEFVFPKQASDVNGFRTVELTIPVKSTVFYIGELTGYIGPDGAPAGGERIYNEHTFIGEVTLKVQQRTSAWTIQEASSTTGVFADNLDWTIRNGGLATSKPPTESNYYTLNLDGTLTPTELPTIESES